MNAKPSTPPDSSTANANWGTAVILLVVIIIAVVIGVVVRNGSQNSPGVQLVNPSSSAK